MQLAFTAAGIAVYVGTIIIGVIVPSSPFRTPLSKYMLRVGSVTWRFMRVITRSVIDRLYSMALQRLYDEYCSPLLIWGQERIPQVLKFPLKPFPWSSKTAVSDNTNAVEASQWTSSEAVAAECVIWLLEHSEHVDTTVAALHACLRLPSPLLVSLIDEREGLRERILNFHGNLQQQGGLGNQKWEELRDRMFVSSLALFHLFKGDDQNTASWTGSDEEIQIAIFGSYIHLWFPVPPKPNPDLVKPLQLRIELTDTRQAIVMNPLVVSVNQAHLLAEGIACKFLYEFDRDLVPVTKLDSEPFAEVIQMFQFLLANQPTFRDIGYVAMAIAALHWRIDSGSEVNHWGYSSVEDKQRFKQKITQIIQALDKSKVVAQSIAIALSLLDPLCPDQLSPLHDHLLRILKTAWLSDSYLASVLLESYWKHSGDKNSGDKRQALIVQALGRSVLWLELNTERADSLSRLIKHEISISDNRDKSTKDSLSRIIDRLASASDDDVFDSVFLSEAGLLNNSFVSAFRKDTSELTRRLQHSAPSLVGQFPEIWAYLVDQTLEQLVGIHHKAYSFIGPYFIFLHQLISTEAGLHWPTYFPSELVTEISDLKSMGLNSDRWDGDQLMALEKDPDGLSKAVLGESVLLSWRATHHMSQCGRLPSSWNDHKFFEAEVVNIILDYYVYVRKQGYIGVDYDTLRRYFEAFLQNSEHGVGEPSDDKLPQTPESTGEGSRTDGLNAETSRAASNALVNGVPTIEDQVPNDAQIRMRIEEALETLG
ncbi:hypothetical protein FRC03_006093, partial [Tulasnella sp. 419]